MKEETRSFGYICPKCGKSVVAKRTVFALQAAAAAVVCDCGESELIIETTGTSYRLHVPCGVCGETHRAECSADALLSGQGVGFACPETRQLCCYAGEEHRVARAMTELSETIERERVRGDAPDAEAFADSVIMYEVLSELKEIAARPHGVRCMCGSEKYSIEVRRTWVDLICHDCGAKLRIGAATDEDLDRLCCNMTLTIGAVGGK